MIKKTFYVISSLILTLKVDAQKVSFNGFSAASVCNNGSVWTWSGDNYNGQLGNGTNVTSATDLYPKAVVNLVGYSEVCVGYKHVLALKNDGTVWAWGDNYYGQLGNGNYNDSYAPQQVPGLINIIKVSAGTYYSMALRNDGTVYTWGYNAQGQLGTGSSSYDSNTPSVVPSLSGITKIDAGSYAAIALKSDGTVYTWGDNSWGCLGIGNFTSQSTPVIISTLSNVNTIAMGRFNGYAGKNDGTFWAWGGNTVGELGIGSTSSTAITSPVQVVTLNNVAEISAGVQFFVVLKNDGTVWGSGDNLFGQLGIGNTTNQSSPVQVSGITNGVHLARSLASTSGVIKSDGTLWCWGGNGGMFGNGNYSSSSTPIHIDKYCGGVDIGEFVTQMKFSIFPNPSDEKITVVYKENSEGMILLNDCFGRTVYSARLNPSGISSISTNFVSEGIYNIQIQCNNKTSSQRIIVKH